MSGDEARKKIETYLKQVRERLRGFREDQVREITEELRSHIMERAAVHGELTVVGVNAALEALGSPEEIAREYEKYEVLARAAMSRSPLRLLDGLFGWASVSIAGFFVLIGAITGYFLGFAFLLVAWLKPFHPESAGLWTLGNPGVDLELSLRMGFGTPPSGGRELLGWWIIPLGLVMGCGLVVGTTRFALWCVGIYSRARRVPRI